MEIFSLLSLGVVAGIVAGLLGVGGGVVIVPVLIWIFKHYTEIPSINIIHVAIGTSLAIIVITSFSSIIAHNRHRTIRWSIVWRLTPGIIIGSVLGAVIADSLPSETLRIIFAIFILFISVQLSFLSPPTSYHQLPNRLGVGIISILIGSISTLVGIGGGSLTVPFLVGCNLPIRNAIATSAACGFPIAISGSIGFIVIGWQVSELPIGTSGYIYWPAFFTIAPASLLFAPLGVKLALIIPVNVLKNFFAIFLAGVGLKMLILF